MTTQQPTVDHDQQQRWVVGVDGSETAREALRWAVAHAPGRAEEITVVTAWQTPVYAQTMAAPMTVPIDDDAIAESARLTASHEMEHVRESCPVELRAHVGHGSPSRTLLDEATDASLLVVGTRGHGGFGRLLLGSTSTQCATHSDVPVVVVPAGGFEADTSKILVAVDGSQNSLEALAWALRFARPGTRMCAMWVWDATPLAVGADEFFFPDASDTAEERFHHVVDEVMATAGRDDVTVERSFVHGRPRTRIADTAERADLLVVGARGHGAVGAALLGSVSTWLLHHVDRPVAVVPHPTDDETAAASVADD